MKGKITDLRTGESKLVDLTEAEKLEIEYFNNHIAPIQAMKNLRRRRNQLLTESDWTQSRDVFLPNDEEWKTYRQQLRDLPKNTEPMNPVWPTKPF